MTQAGFFIGEKMITVEEIAKYRGVKVVPVMGFPNIYCMSDGSFWSTIRNFGKGPKELKQRIDRNGYPMVSLWSPIKKKTINKVAHRLIARSFYGLPNYERPEVRHLDGNRANNNLDNLMWGTSKDNSDDAKRMGRIPSGENHHRAKLTNKQAEEICNFYINGEYTQHELAQKYNVKYGVINCIINGTTFENIGVKIQTRFPRKTKALFDQIKNLKDEIKTLKGICEELHKDNFRLCSDNADLAGQVERLMDENIGRNV